MLSQRMESEARRIYQAEVKLWLVRSLFPPAAGWRVGVHLDPMELAKGGTHQPDKKERAAAAERELISLGVKLGVDEKYGRIDTVADHRQHGLHLIEVEGDSSRQQEQAIYSCLGQLLLTMRGWGGSLHYGIAVPNTNGWHMQLAKIPTAVRSRLSIDLYLVDHTHVVKYEPSEEMPRTLRT